ncbi:hypothetical protein C0J52_00396 [Blattella germanica]|nr:hypothetical protein C0J52_00396 [Blattella germanica]
MLKVWTEEFLSTVAKLDPKFIALHCQEVGGKNYKCSMKHVEFFVRLLVSSEELRLFDRVQVFLDEDYSSAENFTSKALYLQEGRRFTLGTSRLSVQRKKLNSRRPSFQRFHNHRCGSAPFFLFGDFNFRTDTHAVVQLREYDRELEPFASQLFEFPISFQPSYPFEEDEQGAKLYMKTRCPAWCDRILLSNSAKSLVKNFSQADSVLYGLMGTSTSMGDHKPVYLRLQMDLSAGMMTLAALLCLALYASPRAAFLLIDDI